MAGERGAVSENKLNGQGQPMGTPTARGSVSRAYVVSGRDGPAAKRLPQPGQWA